MIAFIDDHRDAHGVEPIREVLPIAPSTYRAHAAARRDPGKGSARAKRDAGPREKIRRVYDENFQVHGARKIWRQLNREGESVARCTVERLMRGMGLQGAVRGKPVKTTVSDKVIWRRGPWRNFEQVEFATLERVDWFNNRRLLEPIGNIPPAEAEARYHAQLDEPAIAA